MSVEQNCNNVKFIRHLQVKISNYTFQKNS